MKDFQAIKPIVLTILDGWGISANKHGDAVQNAPMDHIEHFKKQYPWVALDASGTAVGLPAGQMGNSEVGHNHIGAGRIQYEAFTRINQSIKQDLFKKNPALLKAINYAKKHDSSFHLIGLFSDGGVHSHMDHMLYTYQVLVQHQIPHIYFHLIGDGRDTKPQVFDGYLNTLKKLIAKYPGGKIASISGRYYTMDRDKRFERTDQAYQAIVNHQGSAFEDASAYVEAQFKAKINDEFLVPAYNSTTPEAKFKEHDVVFFTNFRPDRAIQFNSALTNPDYLYPFQPFLKNLFVLNMVKYSASVHEQAVCFPPVLPHNYLGAWLSKHHQKQLRISETEKIAHVTFFLDGGKDYFKNGLAKPEEITLPEADSILIPSPKVATYDLQPTMSSKELTDSLVKAIESKKYAFIVVNYPNGDMVGHTGVYQAAVEACQAMDHCLKEVHDAVMKVKGVMLITADHGNCEVMFDKNNGPNKKHTTNQVPFIVCSQQKFALKKQQLGLANIAPTILELLKLPIPAEMTAESLLATKQK